MDGSLRERKEGEETEAAGAAVAAAAGEGGPLSRGTAEPPPWPTPSKLELSSATGVVQAGSGMKKEFSYY